MRRRDALTGALLAAVAPSATAAPVDPHMAWLEEWRALMKAFEALPDDGPADPYGWFDRMWQLAHLIADTPATSADGIIAANEFLCLHSEEFRTIGENPEIYRPILKQTISFLRGA